MDMEFLNNPISPYDVRDYHISGVAKDYPEAFALETVSVLNQGSQSTCVAHACATLVEYFNYIQQNNDTKFSTEFIYGYRPDGYYVGDGMCIRDALKTLQKVGVPPIDYLKGNHNYETAMKKVEESFEELKDVAFPNRISTYMRVYSIKEIKEALTKYGYVICSMPWYKEYKLVDSVYTYDDTSKKGNHAVVIYGWNDKGWLVQNSWGKLWGDGGKFIVPFDFKWNENWAVTDTIVNDEDIVKPIEKWYIRWFNKIINFFGNLFSKKK